MKNTLKPVSISNTSKWDKENVCTVEIKSSDANWKEALKNWKEGKNPTNSSEWKKGVFLHFEWVKS